MTFGEYLREILTEREINPTHLARSTGIKSKNEIYRLFENNCSYKKTLEMFNMISAHVEFTEEEKHKLLELMSECKVGVSKRKAYNTLSLLYKNEEQRQEAEFSEVCGFIKKYSSGKVTVYPDVLTPSESLMLNDAIAGLDNVFVKHVVNFNTSDEMIARELFEIITLFQNENYEFFESTFCGFFDTFLIAENNGDYMIAIYDKHKFYEGRIAREAAEIIEKKCSELFYNTSKEKNGKVSDYIDIINFSACADINNIYSLYGMQCMGDISYDVMESLFEDADFCGFPRNHPYVLKFLQAVNERECLRKKSQAQKRYVLSEKSVREFLKTGRTADYMSCFRKLSKEERRAFLNKFLEKTEGAEHLGRFFGDGFSEILTECVYIENTGIFLSSTGKGFDKVSQNALITHPKAQAVFSGFCKWFWDNCTYSEEESAKKLKTLMENI